MSIDEAGIAEDSPTPTDMTDPWPGRAEALAALLVVAGACLLVAAAVYGLAMASEQTVGSVSTATKLRAAAQDVSPFVGLFALGAVFLVALDDITSGVRAGPSTAIAQATLWGASIVAAVAAVATGGRAIDILVGHSQPFLRAAPGGLRWSAALTELAVTLPAVAALHLSVRGFSDAESRESSTDGLEEQMLS